MAKLINVTVVVFLTVTVLAAQQKNPLTNADVIKMVKSGLAETTIAAAIAAKDTGLPLRIEMVDASGAGGIQMNYGPLTGPANIEIPACMNAK